VQDWRPANRNLLEIVATGSVFGNLAQSTVIACKQKLQVAFWGCELEEEKSINSSNSSKRALNLFCGLRDSEKI